MTNKTPEELAREYVANAPMGYFYPYRHLMQAFIDGYNMGEKGGGSLEVRFYERFEQIRERDKKFDTAKEQGVANIESASKYIWTTETVKEK